MIKPLLSVFFIAFILSACQAQPPQSLAPVQPPQPTNEVSKVPIYTSFAELEPILQKTTDTTYVINFWATWCKPCIEELPYFEALHETFADKKIKVILVSLDFAKDIESKLLPFVQKRQLKSQVVALTDGKYHNWIDKVDPAWSGAIPVTVVYRADERVFIEEQFPDAEALKNIVSKML